MLSKVARLGLTGLPILIAVTASAQVTPRIWLWNKGNNTFTGDLAPNRDSRFREAVHYNMKWGLANRRSTWSDPLASRSGQKTAQRLLEEIQARQLAGADTTIFFAFFALRGIESGFDSSGRQYVRHGYGGVPNHPDEGDAVFPSLYTQEDDMMKVEYSDVSRLERTPWTNTGIAKMSLWFKDLLVTYNTDGGPMPARLVFDQEIPVNVESFNWSDTCKYWQTLHDDDRFSERLLPGFNGATLKDLWIQAGSPVPVLTPPPGEYNTLYKGNSANNHKWYVWFVSLFRQVYAATMAEAVYDRVAIYWPTTKCADYDSTIRLDGAVGEFSEPANALLDGSYTGTLGPGGMRYVFQSPGSNILSNPHFYAAANGWIWRFFGPEPGPRIKWANTDDRYSPTYGLVANGFQAPRGVPDGHEFWWETSARMNRFYADALVRSFRNESREYLAWVTIPNQPSYFPAILDYDGQALGEHSNQALRGPFTREPLVATYRTLAMCKSRGMNELIVWNDTGFDVPTNSTYNHGVHGDYPKNWDKFKRAVDLVWGCEPTNFYVDPSNQLPQGLSQAARVERVRLSDLNYTNLGANTVQVVAPSTVPLWAVTDFTMNLAATGVSGPPPVLNFEYEVRLTQAAPVSLFIWDRVAGIWKAIGQTGGVPEIDGRHYPVNSTANKTLRLRARIKRQPQYVDPVTGVVKVAFSTPAREPAFAWGARVAQAAGSAVAYFDLTQCYGSDEGLRQMGDFNGDGNVNDDDNLLFDQMYDLFQSPNPNEVATVVFPQALDVNHDGQIDYADKAAWYDIWNGTVARPNWRYEWIDDGRQVATDYHPQP